MLALVNKLGLEVLDVDSSDSRKRRRLGCDELELHEVVVNPDANDQKRGHTAGDAGDEPSVETRAGGRAGGGLGLVLSAIVPVCAIHVGGVATEAMGVEWREGCGKAGHQMSAAARAWQPTLDQRS
eukprot:3120883-Rhodomonas_salina.1